MRFGTSRIAALCLVLSLVLLASVALLPTGGFAATEKGAAEVIFIKSPGCTKCAAAERTLDRVSREVPINITSYYYYTDEGHRIIKQYRAKDVPAIIIGMQVINYRDYEKDDDLLERLIKSALANQTVDHPAAFTLPVNESEKQSFSNDGGQSLNLEKISLYTLSAVLVAGLVAGFNPCLLGILVFLAATVLSTAGKRRELVMMVVFFSLGIFTMYLLLGLGMQQLLQTESIVSAFRSILTAFLILAGFSQVWDAVRLKQGQPSIFRTDWALKYFQAGIDRGRFSSYFVIGALFSLVKAPCLVGIYLAILDLLSARSYIEGATYLLFFNLGVILPILILGGAIALGMSPEQVDSFRKDHRVGIRLATGITLIALAPLIYWQLI
jgi:cytochrome c-type biogenesis protein